MFGRWIAVLFTGLALAGVGLPAVAAPVSTGHLEAELVSSTVGARPGETVTVAVRQKIAEGWHTYWRNSGDSGAASELKWTLPEGWSAGPIAWPTPRRLPEATLMTYGYEGEVALPVTLTVPASARPGSEAEIRVRADFLVCRDLCVPESADLSLRLPITAETPAADPRGAAIIARAAAASPKPWTGAATFRLDGEVLRLGLSGTALKGRDPAGAYFYPYAADLILHPSPQAVERGSDGLTLTLAPKPGAKAPTTVEGVLATHDGAWIVTAAPGAMPAGSGGLGAVADAGDTVAGGDPTGGTSLGFAMAMLFALLGGLALNLMPCVFPVLSMKAAHLADRAHAPEHARRDGLWFLAGTVASFLTLAVILVLAKAAGQAIGWGFQLQSSKTTAFLALFTLVIAMNLSGVFEAGGSLQGLGSRLQRRAGAMGAFFTGVLAVVVGAPCTAPFMASAIGYALTAGPAETLLVFAGLGLGLGLPFLLLSFSPALLRRLPRPGPWMDRLRHILAFPMYGTAAFMAWVFAQQAGAGALGWLLGAGVFLALAVYLWGDLQRTGETGRQILWSLGGAALALMIAVFLGLWAAMAPLESRQGPAALGDAALHPEAWSPTRVDELTSEGRTVFVNFTAAWCVTCKVNEQTVFARPEVADAFRRSNAAYLVADWTRRDAAIAATLQAYGRPGVPLYLVFRPGSDRAEVLPQLLSPGRVAQALRGQG